MPFTIRSARADDAAAIAAVHVEGWRWGYRGQLPDPFLDGLDVSARTERWRGILAGDLGPASTLVAEAGGGIVGFASCGPSRDEQAADEEGEEHAGRSDAAPLADGAGPSRDDAVAGADAVAPSGDEAQGEVYAIYVAEAVAGTGVGPELLRRAVAELWARFGCRKAILWVLESNARARRFYEREGWRPDGGTKTDEAGGVPLPEVRYRIRR